MKFINLCFLVLIIIFVTSCENNQIYYNNDSKSVISCDGYKLTKLKITDKKEFISYYYNSNDFKLATETIYLFKDNPGYIFSTYTKDSISNKIEFNPNTEYTITNLSEGDATEIAINIKINENGQVFYFDKKECY